MSVGRILVKVRDTREYMGTYLDATNGWARGESGTEPSPSFLRFRRLTMAAYNALTELEEELERSIERRK